MAWKWRERPEPWLIGKWADSGSPDMDVMGEGLPPGLVARCEVIYAGGAARAYRVSCYSPHEPQNGGWLVVEKPFADVRIEGQRADVLNDAGTIGPQGPPKILFHRSDRWGGLMVKIIHANTNKRITRVYTFIEAYDDAA
jgi:hypothetical protein